MRTGHSVVFFKPLSFVEPLHLLFAKEVHGDELAESSENIHEGYEEVDVHCIEVVDIGQHGLARVHDQNHAQHPCHPYVGPAGGHLCHSGPPSVGDDPERGPGDDHYDGCRDVALNQEVHQVPGECELQNAPLVGPWKKGKHQSDIDDLSFVY